MWVPYMGMGSSVWRYQQEKQESLSEAEMPQLQKKRALGKNEVEPLYLFVCVSFFFSFL